jgi:hypothetical protein
MIGRIDPFIGVVGQPPNLIGQRQLLSLRWRDSSQPPSQE